MKIKGAIPKKIVFYELWNQYEAALNRLHKTNNLSEGWHNRFHLMIGKNHPDLYTAFIELQKEQADTEACIAELSMGKKVKAAPRRKWVELQDRISGIVQGYAEYEDNKIEYLGTLSHNHINTLGDKNTASKSWHRYADILIPLISIPTLIYIGFCLHDYVTDPHQQRDPSNGRILVLAGALIVISFAVFCYLCSRLNSPVLSFGKRHFKNNFSLTRSTSSGCFMKSVNSDLQFMVPFKSNHHATYESIIFDVPPRYTVVPDPASMHKHKMSSSINPLKIVEV